MRARNQRNRNRRKIVTSLLASGSALVAGATAEANIIETTVNQELGPGGPASETQYYKLNLPYKNLQAGNNGSYVNMFGSSRGRSKFSFNLSASSGAGVKLYGNPKGTWAVRAAAGKKWSTIAASSNVAGHAGIASFAKTARGATKTNGPGDFTDQYFAFKFVNGNTGQTGYGWMYGSLTGTYANKTYDLISYAYDDTGAEIPMGATNPVPEPGSLALCAMAALVAGAAGMRRFKYAKNAMPVARSVTAA